MQHNGWDHALKVTADGAGLVGHAGAILLRKAADQAGLTGFTSEERPVLGDSRLPHTRFPDLERSSPWSITGGPMP